MIGFIDALSKPAANRAPDLGLFSSKQLSTLCSL